MAALIVLLFLYHVDRAATVHLNPDEALHYQLAHQHSIREAYAANNTNAHPPLLVLMLQSWMKLGTSEVFLRLLPILAYCGFLWFTYRWALLALGAEPALAATVIVAFAPPVFNLAIEIRHYTMLLCWIAAAMWAMERAFQERALPERSARWTAASAGFLYLAILSHYSAMWFVPAFGVYCLLRIRQQALPPSGVRVWVAGQVVAVGIYAVLYVTHISHLRGAAITQEAREGWLRQFYRLPGDDAIHYLIGNTQGLFEYLFASQWAALIAGGLFLASIVLLLRRQRILLAVTLMPWVTYAAAAWSGVYPYGGTRHGVFLTLPLAISAAIALAAATKEKLWILSALLLALVPLWRAAAVPEVQVLPDERQKRELMVEAVKYLRTVVPSRGLVLADYQSSLLLCYYYDPRKFCIDEGGRHFSHYDLGEIRVAVSRSWSLDTTRFTEELQYLKKEYDLKPGVEIWVFVGGWGVPLHQMLHAHGVPLPGLRSFGQSIGVFRAPS